MTFDTAGRSMMGIKPGDYSDFAAEIELQGFGANCGIGPAELIDSVSYFDSRQQDRFVIAKGNCGIPAYVDGEIHYHGTPELMAEYAVIARDLGVRIVGGCCGTSPEHIRAMRTALDSVQKSPPPPKKKLKNAWGWPGKICNRPRRQIARTGAIAAAGVPGETDRLHRRLLAGRCLPT